MCRQTESIRRVGRFKPAVGSLVQENSGTKQDGERVQPVQNQFDCFRIA